MHLTDSVNLFGVEEDSFRGGRFSRVDMRNDTDVACSIEGVFSARHVIPQRLAACGD
jgi:hypothetical protein